MGVVLDSTLTMWSLYELDNFRILVPNMFLNYSCLKLQEYFKANECVMVISFDGFLKD